jgi:hypothetical protein
MRSGFAGEGKVLFDFRAVGFDEDLMGNLVDKLGDVSVGKTTSEFLLEPLSQCGEADERVDSACVAHFSSYFCLDRGQNSLIPHSDLFTNGDKGMATKRIALAPRNDPLGLAERGWTNLLTIERSFKTHGEGHVVTQLVQTLLAILVFPKGKDFFEYMAHLQLDSLTNWPIPKQVLGATPNMGQLLRHMRNAVCHGLVTFYGDSTDGAESRFVDEISIEFADRPNEDSDINWKIIMEGEDLKLFLYKLLDFLHDGYPGPFES